MPKLYENFGISVCFYAGAHFVLNKPVKLEILTRGIRWKAMYLRIKEARYIPRYKMGLKFNDGKRHVVDFAPCLKRATNLMFTQYRALKKFKASHIESGDLMWGDFEMIFPIAGLHRGEI